MGPAGHRTQLWRRITIGLLLAHLWQVTADEKALQATVTVDPSVTAGAINPLLFGNNVVAAGGSGPAIWNEEAGELYPAPLEAITQLRPTLLRFPGGGKASHYDWRDSVGPKRKESYAFSAFGTDEWLKLCRAVGAEPIFTINWASGNPGLAAQWVEYCNGAASTRMGARRAKNGHPEPYGVKYWEIGNETYGSARATEYAHTLDAYAAAMKRVDPSIKVGAVGWAWNGWLNHYHPDTMDWNETVIDVAVDDIDFFVIHPYAWISDKPESYDAALAQAVLSFPGQFERDLVGIRELCAAHDAPDMPIFATEYNSYFGELGMSAPLVQQVNAVFACGMLNAFARQGIDAACYWELLTVGWGHFSNIMHLEARRLQLRPTYTALKLYRDEIAGNLIGTQVQCGRYATKGISTVRAKASEPFLDVIACARGDGKQVVALVWKHATRAGEVQIRLPARPAGVTTKLLMATGPYAQDTHVQETDVDASGSTVTVQMPPVSAAIAIIEP